MPHMMFSRKQASIPSLLALVAALILSGCGAPDRSAPPSTAAAPTIAPAAVAAAKPGDRLYIRDGFKGDAERLTIIDSISGARERDLPAGVTSPDWATMYVAEQSDGKTRVRALDIDSGRTLRETTLDGAYGLPMITPDSVMGGLSPDGRWLALKATPAQSDGKKTRFAVLDTTFKQTPKQASLDGDFHFDGLSNSGGSLFLTESLSSDPTAKYQVRLYNLSLGALDPNVVVAKGESQIMSGSRQTAVTSNNGEWLYSLYVNPDYGPFIHALNLTGPVAFCIDLPKDGKADLSKQGRWSLALSKDGRALYAVNGALGLVAEVNLGGDWPQLARTKTLLDHPANAVATAVAAQSHTSNVSALSPDGKTLFTVGEQGLLVIDTNSLALRGRYLADWPLDGVALSPDGARLYAASAAQGKIVQLDPVAGTIAAEVPAAGRPTGVVRVEART
jgi:hypothetical protein